MKAIEKSILKGIYAVTLIMFSILSFSGKSFDYGPLILGISSCILIAYSHFIIKRFFPEGDKFLLIIAAFLAQFGLVELYRLSPATAWKQLTWFTLGIGTYIFLVVFLPNINRISKLKYVFIAVTILLLGSTLFAGSEIKGSKNWLLIAGFSFQPSEIAKLFLILYLASAIKGIKKFKDVVILSIPVFVCIGLLVLEKDLGAGLIFFGIFIAMLYIGTSNLIYISSFASLFAAGGFLSYFIFPHVKTRIDIWIDPWKYEKGYQICQSLFAIAAGGLIGTGIGLGHPEFIPEVYSDFIFSAICEELGLLGALAVIILYLMLVYRG
jgi:cell division protein FtsW (lipid II flippase)